MEEKKRNETYEKIRRWWQIGLFACGIILIALLLQAGILSNVNEKNANKTSEVLLNQAVSIIEKNQQSEAEMIQSLKEDYMVRAKAVSYIIDAKPDAEYDQEELQKIADLVSVDEVHLFDDTGTIYSGSVPEYYGYNFDSGEQMAYFKPMLENKKLTMCQDVTPNTSEGKNMMYAITWNEAGTRMVQVGIEPVRLLKEVKQNEVPSVVSNMPVYEGISIYVADEDSGEIYGATDEENIGKTLDEIGLPKKNTEEGKLITDTAYINGEKYNCVFEKSGKYIIGVTFATSSNNESNFIAMFIVAMYLILATGCILFMFSRVSKTNDEKKKLLHTSNTDELTGCFNRRAYEKDIADISMEAEFIYISMDVNGLKEVNDSLGHLVGDELLKGASYCMKKCFESCGKVYRVGGDEFIAILFTNRREFREIKEDFDKMVRNWSGEQLDSLSVSCGFVSSREKEWESLSSIVEAADTRMYEAKSRYYSENGTDRRRRRDIKNQK